MSSRLRLLAAACAAGLAAAALALMRAPMRITLVNATLRIDDPWTRPAALALAGAAALAVAAALPPRRSHRLLLGGCAALLFAAAASAGTAWLEARPDALAARRLFVTRTIPWGEVSRVDARHDGVTVWDASGAAVDFDARRLSPDQRAVLDRTLARRVREGPPATAR